jgi:3-phosphoglycerate kinase
MQNAESRPHAGPGTKTLDDRVIESRHPFVRADLDLAMKNGAVSDVARIDGAADTVRDILQRRESRLSSRISGKSF